MSLSSSFSSFFFLSFFTPTHFKRCSQWRHSGCRMGPWEGPACPPISMQVVGGCLCLPCAGAPGSSAAPASPGFFTRSRRGFASGSSTGSCRFFFSFCPTDSAAEIVPALNPFSLCKASPAHTAPSPFPKYRQAFPWPHMGAGTHFRDGDTVAPSNEQLTMGQSPGEGRRRKTEKGC